MARLNPVDPNTLNADQKRLRDQIIANGWGGVRPAFGIFLHDPELMAVLEPFAGYFRLHSKLPDGIRELATLVVARDRRVDYIWIAHAANAVKAGIDPDVVRSIGEGATPSFQDEHQASAYHYCAEFLAPESVSDETFARALKSWGPTGILELSGLVGFYAMWGMTLTALKIDTPADAEVPW